MHFFSRLLFSCFWILLSSSSSFGMSSRCMEEPSGNAVLKIFRKLGEEGRLLALHEETSSEKSKNIALDKKLSGLLAPLHKDIESKGTTTLWLSILDLTPHERSLLEKSYKLLCKKIYDLDLTEDPSEPCFFSKSLYLLQALQGPIFLEKETQENAFFLCAFYDLLTFKKQKAESLLKKFAQAQDYFLTIEYETLFLEVYKTLLIGNEMNKKPLPTLKDLQSIIQRKVEADFRPPYFSQDDKATFQKSIQKDAEDWLKSPELFKMSLDATSTYLREICDLSLFSSMYHALQNSNLLRLRIFIKTLQDSLTTHLNPLKDLLEKEAFSLQRPSPIEFSMDFLKAATRLPSCLEAPLQNPQHPLNVLLREEVGLISSTLKKEGGQYATSFELKACTYHICASMVQTFKTCAWPHFPKIQPVTQVRSLPAKPSFLADVDISILEVASKQQTEEIRALQEKLQSQEALLRELQSQAAYQELMKEDPSKTPKKKKKKKATQAAAGDSPLELSSCLKKEVPGPAIFGEREELEKTIRGLEEALKKKTEGFAELEASLQLFERNTHTLKDQLQSLAEIQKDGSVSLESTLEQVRQKWEELKKSLDEKDALLQSQKDRLEQNFFQEKEALQRSLQASIEKIQTELTQKSQEFQSVQEEHKRKKSQWEKTVTGRIYKFLSFGHQKGSSLEDALNQMEAELVKLRADESRTSASLEASRNTAQGLDRSLKETTLKLAQAENALQRKEEEDAREKNQWRTLLVRLADLQEDSPSSFLDILKKLQEMKNDWISSLRRQEEELSSLRTQKEENTFLEKKIKDLEKKILKQVQEVNHLQHHSLQKDSLFHALSQEKERMAKILQDLQNTLATSARSYASREKEWGRYLQAEHEKNQDFTRKISSLIAQTESLRQQLSMTISQDCFRDFQKEFYDLKGDLMASLQKLMEGTPDEKRRLLGSIAALEDLYRRGCELFPHHTLPSPHFIMMGAPPLPSFPFVRLPPPASHPMAPLFIPSFETI